MKRRNLRVRAADDVTAILFDRRGAPEDCPRGGRTETNDQCRAEQLELAFEPLMTRADLQLVRLLVDPPLAAQLELEVLDRVRDIRRLAVDGCIGQSTVEELAGRSDERLAGAIFLVAGLLADQQDAGPLATHPEHGLRCVFPERASAAMGCLLAHCGQ